MVIAQTCSPKYGDLGGRRLLIIMESHGCGSLEEGAAKHVTRPHGDGVKILKERQIWGGADILLEKENVGGILKTGSRTRGRPGNFMRWETARDGGGG